MIERRYSFPRAPITVVHQNERETNFEVEASGDVALTVQVPDYTTFSRDATMEFTFYFSPEDWREVVAHIEGDLRTGSRD